MTLRKVDRVYYLASDGTTLSEVGEVVYTGDGLSTRAVPEIQLYVDDTPKPGLTVALTSSPKSPVAAGDTVTITATVSGGLAPYTRQITAAPGAPAPQATGVVGQWRIVVPAGAATGTEYAYTVAVSDSSDPARTGSASVVIGVGTTPGNPDPLAVSIRQSPGNPVHRGDTVAYRVDVVGGTPPYTYVWAKGTNGPAWTGTGPARDMLIPNTATEGQSWFVRCTVTDSTPGAPQTASHEVTSRVTLSTGTRRDFAGRPATTIQGNSSSRDVWDARFSEMQALGRLTARRIFGDLAATDRGFNADDLILEAINDGQFPIVSFKDGGANSSPDSVLANGVTRRQAAQRFANWLATLPVPVGVCYWHEPHDNFAGTTASSPTPFATDAEGAAVYVSKVKVYMPLFKKPNIVRFPLHNGWLVGNRSARLTQLCPDELMDGDYYECWGFDSYQAGTYTNPLNPWPGDKLTQLVQYLAQRGYGHWQCVVGEWNAWRAEPIYDMGIKCLETVNSLGDRFIWASMMWNSTIGKGKTLESGAGDYYRLDAYKAVLARGDYVRGKLVPDAPGTLSVTGQTGSSITLSWSHGSIPAGGGARTGYRVYLRKGSNSYVTIPAEPGAAATSVTLSGLTAGVHRLQVHALNAQGEGYPSNIVTVTL